MERVLAAIPPQDRLHLACEFIGAASRHRWAALAVDVQEEDLLALEDALA